jgi:hypothetical protein
MQTESDLKPLPEIGEFDARVWVKNPRQTTLPLAVEPWGVLLHLLPETSYLLVSQFNSAEEVEAPILEPDVYLTVWPQGSKSNHIYRDDGNLIWDNERPGAVYPLLTDRVIQSALQLVKK